MNIAGNLADAIDHHPEWTHSDNKVEILLSTHDAKGLSVKDILLAKAMV